MCARILIIIRTRARAKREKEEEKRCRSRFAEKRENEFCALSLSPPRELSKNSRRRRKRVPNFFAQNHFRVSKFLEKRTKKEEKETKRTKKAKLRARILLVSPRACVHARAREEERESVCECERARIRLLFSFSVRSLFVGILLLIYRDIMTV